MLAAFLVLASSVSTMPDEDSDDPTVPEEPSGKMLTEKRKQQAAGRMAAEVLWLQILSRLQGKL